MNGFSIIGAPSAREMRGFVIRPVRTAERFAKYNKDRCRGLYSIRRWVVLEQDRPRLLPEFESGPLQHAYVSLAAAIDTGIT